MSGPVRVAVWLIERFAPPSYAKSLAGDLAEECAAGRTGTWVWRQVLLAMGERLRSEGRRCALPLGFSVAWSMLYPAWDGLLWRGALLQGLFARWSGLDWPYSTSLLVAGGVLPAATFIWIGLFAYLGLRSPAIGRPTILRVVASLSLSMSVLLVMGIGLRSWLGVPEIHATALGAVALLSASPFRLADALLATSSLLVGIVFAVAAPAERSETVLAR